MSDIKAKEPKKLTNNIWSARNFTSVYIYIAGNIGNVWQMKHLGMVIISSLFVYFQKFYNKFPISIIIVKSMKNPCILSHLFQSFLL